MAKKITKSSETSYFSYLGQTSPTKKIRLKIKFMRGFDAPQCASEVLWDLNACFKDIKELKFSDIRELTLSQKVDVTK